MEIRSENSSSNRKTRELWMFRGNLYRITLFVALLAAFCLAGDLNLSLQRVADQANPGNAAKMNRTGLVSLKVKDNIAFSFSD